MWHIIVPASLSIDTVKKVSMQSVLKGEVALSHNGVDYGFVEKREKEHLTDRILVPELERNSYRNISSAIARTLYMQQRIHRPSTYSPSSGSRAITSQTSQKKYVRQQPADLRMRYKPFGDTGCDSKRTKSWTSTQTSGNKGISDRSFKVPVEIEELRQVLKPRHPNADDASLHQQDTPKKKRRKEGREDPERLTDQPNGPPARSHNLKGHDRKKGKRKGNAMGSGIA